MIDASELLPRLFGRVLIPEIVAAELSQPSTPAVVRTWLSAAPSWLERRSVTAAGMFPRRLGAGESAAITLAQTTNASLLLIDDRAGSVAARARGLETLGTIGILAPVTILSISPRCSIGSRRRTSVISRRCSMRCWPGTGSGNEYSVPVFPIPALTQYLSQ